MIIRAIIMITSYYTINFAAWNLFVNSDWLSSQNALLGSYGILFLITSAVYGEHLLKEWKRLKNQFDKLSTLILDLGLYSILVVAVTTFVVVLVNLLFEINSLPQIETDIALIYSEMPALLNFLLIVIIGPIIEEVTFREAFIGWIDDYNNQLMFYMGSASILLFTHIYMTQVSEFFFYLPFSFLVTDFYFRKRRNVWTSIALHSFYKIFYFIFIQFGFF